MKNLKRLLVIMLTIMIIFESNGISVVAQTVEQTDGEEQITESKGIDSGNDVSALRKINTGNKDSREKDKEKKKINKEKTGENGEEVNKNQDTVKLEKSKLKFASSNDLTSADGNYTYQLLKEKAIITGYNGAGGAITIPSNLDGYPVTSLEVCSFAGTAVTSVTIPKTIVSVGILNSNGPFAGANSLKEVIFEEGTTKIPACICASKDYTSYITNVVLPNSVEEIGNNAFYSCGNLEIVDIPKGVSSIGERAFSECKNLSDVTLHYNSELVEDGAKPFGLEIYARAFSGCEKMESIELTENVTYMGSCVFSGTGIIRITIPKSVARCGCSDSGAGPLSGANKLNEVIFENGIKEIPAHFCSTASTTTNNIARIVLPESTEKIGSYAFFNCVNLVSVDIPKGVSSIEEGAFSGCKILRSVALHFNSETVDDENNGTKPFSLEIHAKVFSGCEKLENIMLTENVIYMGHSVFSGTRITNIMIPKSVTHCGMNSGKGPLSGASKLEEVVFENGTKEIPAYFCESININKVVIPDSVETIGDFAFAYNESLTTIDIPNQVSQIGDHVFQGCKNLQCVDFHSNADIVDDGNDEAKSTGLAIGSYVFSGCEKLKRIILTDTVTYLKQFAFSGTELNSITIPKSVVGCGYARNSAWEYYGPFAGASKLTEVIFEEGIKKIPPYFCSSSDYIINHLTNITKVFIPSTVEEIGAGAFYKCDNMTIYGYKNSYAETYAKKNNIPFKDASEFGFNTPEPSEYRIIVGELQAVNSDKYSIKIDSKEYNVSSDFDFNSAQKILLEHTNKIVIAKASDNIITRVGDIKDILKPIITVQPAVDNIQYEDGKYKKSSFKVKVKIECGVNDSYSLSDISSAVDKIDGLGIDITKVSISSNGSGVFPFLFKDGLLGSQDTTCEKELSVKLKPGKSKEIEFTAYVNNVRVIESVNDDVKITATVNDGISKNSATIHISNLDKQREEEQKRKVNSNRTPEVNKANNILNGAASLYDEAALYNCLTDTEVEAVRAQVTNWVYTSTALNSLIPEESDNSELKKLLDKCGLTPKKLLDKVMKKMGIDKKVISAVRPYTGTLKFEAKDKNTNKNLTITFTMDIDFYEFLESKSSYAGFGTLKYKISNGGSGSGIITYTGYDSFVASLQKILESQIHNCYNIVYGNQINKMSEELVADSLVSGTFARLVNAKYGSAGEFVYTGLKYAFDEYTEEDAKKTLKDITIILTKDYVKKTTGITIHCPVDVTVYDGDGNICAEIKDNVVNDSYSNVVVYVNGDDKYLLLTDSDYAISYSGNDVGSMDYTVTEYENDEIVRVIDYKDVPLSTDKRYVNLLSEGRHQGVSMYNLNELNSDIIEPSSDSNDEEKVISVENISLSESEVLLKTGENHLLVEMISPYNATNSHVTWSSSDDTIVEVDEEGVLSAKAAGNAVITVTSNDGGLHAQCRAVVEKSNGDDAEIKSITLNKSATTIAIGTNEKLSATITPANATNQILKWTSSKEDIVSVDNGVLTAKKVGKAVITVSSFDGKQTATCEITVVDNASDNLKEQERLTVADILAKTYGDPSFTLNIAGGTGTGSVTYSVPENNDVLRIEGDNAIIIGAGTVTITATKAPDATYKAASAEYTLTVAKKILTPSIAGAVKKNYDGKITIANAVSNTLKIELEGMLEKDKSKLSATAASYEFADANVGTNKPVRANGIILKGEAAGNYTLSKDSVTGNVGTITASGEKTDNGKNEGNISDNKNGKNTGGTTDSNTSRRTGGGYSGGSSGGTSSSTSGSSASTASGGTSTSQNGSTTGNTGSSQTGNTQSTEAAKTTFTSGTGGNMITYKITSDTVGSRSVIISSAATNAKKVSIPLTVTDESTNRTYNVIGIGKNAFKNHTKLTSVIIRGNVKSINANAFYGCKKLADVTIYADSLSKIGKNAFKGIKKGAVIKTQAKDKKHYNKIKKLLKNSGIKNVQYKYRLK